jgi:hypothetical protein
VAAVAETDVVVPASVVRGELEALQVRHRVGGELAPSLSDAVDVRSLVSLGLVELLDHAGLGPSRVGGKVGVPDEPPEDDVGDEALQVAVGGSEGEGPGVAGEHQAVVVDGGLDGGDRGGEMVVPADHGALGHPHHGGDAGGDVVRAPGADLVGHGVPGGLEHDPVAGPVGRQHIGPSPADPPLSGERFGQRYPARCDDLPARARLDRSGDQVAHGLVPRRLVAFSRVPALGVCRGDVGEASGPAGVAPVGPHRVRAFGAAQQPGLPDGLGVPLVVLYIQLHRGVP